MIRLWHWLLLPAGMLLSLPCLALPPLQLFIDLTPPGGVLRPPPGRYAGPAVIRHPITLDGEGAVIIDGEGRGTVLTVQADKSVVRGLHLTNSGDSIDAVDAGLLLEAGHTLIEDNTVDNVLFGIHLKKADDNTVRNNRIRARNVELNQRGDGLRLWYSHNNLISQNELLHVRDALLINSTDNRIVGNTIRHSGVGLQLVFAHGTLITDNTLSENQTGLVVLYSEDVTILRNHLSHMRSPSGAALAVKDSSGVVFEENEVLHCSLGVEANAPTHEENTIRFIGNRFAYNDIAMYFYGEKGGHTFNRNRFEGNMLQIAVSAPHSARANDWRGNYWDDYRGFDQNGDEVGDTPYELYIYADRLWMDRPMTRFFRGGLALEIVDFIERLAPFSEPALVLRDPAPQAH